MKLKMKQDDKIDFGLKISDLNTIISVIKENNKINFMKKILNTIGFQF